MRKLLAATAISALMLGGAMAQTSTSGTVPPQVGQGSEQAGSPETTGSTTRSASDDFMTWLGDDRDRFYGADGQMLPEDQFRTNFDALADERRTEIRNYCYQTSPGPELEIKAFCERTQAGG